MESDTDNIAFVLMSVTLTKSEKANYNIYSHSAQYSIKGNPEVTCTWLWVACMLEQSSLCPLTLRILDV